MNRGRMSAADLCSKLEDILEEAVQVIDPAHILEPYFSLVLIKRLSDQFDDEFSSIYDRERQDGVTESDAQAIAKDPDEYRFFVPPEARWLKLVAAKDHVLEAFSAACNALEFSLPPGSSGSLHDFSSLLSQLSKKEAVQLLNRMIKKLNILSFSDQDLTSPHVMAQAAEMHLREIALKSSKILEEAMLPPALTKRLAEILQPQEGMRIYDPLCGTGTALLACHRHLISRGHDARNLSIFAHMNHPNNGVLFRILLLLHNQPDFRVERGSAIREPILNRDRSLTTFDLVVSNLAQAHFETDWELIRLDQHQRFLPSPFIQKRAEITYAQHAAAVLNGRGRAALIVPQGTLFRGGWERDVRAEWLRPEVDIVEAVISLPDRIHAGSDISSSILVLNRNKTAERRRKVLFIDKLASEPQRDKANGIDDEDLFKMIVLYRSFADAGLFSETVEKLSAEWKSCDTIYISRQESENKPDLEERLQRIHQIADRVLDWSRNRGQYAAAVVAAEEITSQHDSNLNPSHYVEGAREYDIDVIAEFAELRQLEQERNSEEMQMNELLRNLGITS